MKINNIFIKVISVIVYLAMIIVNFLANSLPINNRTTGDISDAYPNLFAPAGLTFSIWGLIYLLLAGYLVYQFVAFNKNYKSKKETFLKNVNILFIITSLLNISWIFTWHYDFIGLSVVIMATLLISLIKLADIIRIEKMTLREKIFIATPFTLYFGWITVAAIANVTVFLVSLSWNGFGIAEFIWTSVILLIGALIGILRMQKDKSIIYGLVFVWAYLGILLKHISVSGFNKQYPTIIITLVVCLLFFIFFISRLIYKK